MSEKPRTEPYILIADDDPLTIKSLGIILKRAGYRVVAVSDGAAALERMRQETPVLAILDVMMGKINGLDLVRKIREDTQLKSVIVFLLTARAMHHERAQGLSAGADDYVTKPFVNKELVAKVKAVLNAAHHGSACEPDTAPHSSSS